MAQNWRQTILGLAAVVIALGDGVIAHNDKQKQPDPRAEKGRVARYERQRLPQFRVTDYQLVKVERIDRRVRQFTFRARLRNRGPAIAGATAVLLERRQDIDIVDGELTFGPVEAHGASRSLDTFSFRRRGEHAHLGNLGESVRWEVRPFVGNRPPVAQAGADQSRAVGARTSFDGSRSSDPDGDPLAYRWTLRSRPAASRAELTDAETARPGLAIDAPGTYVAGLVVNDGRASSAEDTVVVTTPNQAPVANAGPDDTVALRARAVLTGAGSADPDGDALTYRWRLASRPAGSAAGLESLTGVSSAVTPDVPGSYVAQLTVNDGRIDSAVDSVVISTRNSAPVARAGADRSAIVRSTVTLDGSASSDADGNPLTFAWTVVSRPAGSVAAPSNPAAVTPSIVVDRPGSYRLRLVVNDGTAAGAPDDVDISTVNSPPVANAGLDAHVAVGQDVVFDGSGSSDVDGDPLTYSWSFSSVPAGSAAAFDAAGSVTPRFTVDRPGNYVAQLIVFDGVVPSVADTVVVTTRNSAPIARAGADQTAVAGAQVPLNGTASSDPDGTPLTFAWSFVSLPAGSRAAIVNPTSPTPVFRADRNGLYVVQLAVSDGVLSSDPDTVSVSTTNTVPVARAGVDLLDVPVDGLVPLDGSASSDADGHALSFRWALLSAPAGSAATLSAATSAMPSFVADRPGDYVAQLIVSDGLVDSTPDTVLVRTANRPPAAGAGTDQAVAVGATLTLDGTASSDPDGNPLSFEWAFVRVPNGSTAAMVAGVPGQASFVADVAGDFVVRLTVTDGAGGSATDDVTVHVAAPGRLDVPATLTWPALQIGGSAQRTLLVTNNGSSPFTVDAAEATGDFMVEDAASSCLAGPVAAGATCELRLTFTPAETGTRTGSLAIDSDAPGSPHTVALSGDAVPANVTAAPATLTFAATRVGQSGGPSSGVVTNAGSGDVEISGVTVSGDFSLATSAGDRCQTGTILAPAAACSVAATFQPTASGARTGSVSIEAHGAGDGTILSRSIALQGDGLSLPVVSLAVTDGSASEFDNEPGSVTLSRTGSLMSPLTVQYAATGRAINGVDYTLLSGSATFAVGQGTTVVTVTPSTDALNEGTESVTLTLVEGTDYDLGAATSGAIAIEDGFQQVTIFATDATGSEAGPDTASVTVSRLGNTSRALTVNLAFGGTATAVLDYQALGPSVVIPAGQASALVVITPTSDGVVEGTETLIVTVVGGATYGLGTPAAATVTILDPPTVTLTVVDPDASEVGLDAGAFRFTRTGDTAVSLTVTLSSAGSTATNVSDYANIGSTLVFPAGQAVVDRPVVPVNDNRVEGPETVVLTIVDGANYDLGAVVTGTVTIQDQPPPVITVQAIDPSASETGPDSGTFRFTRAGDTGLSLTVSFTRTGSAANGDYNSGALGTSVTFSAGQATVDRVVTPIPDAAVEVGETVVVTLTDGANYDLGMPATATVTITD